MQTEFVFQQKKTLAAKPKQNELNNSNESVGREMCMCVCVCVCVCVCNRNMEWVYVICDFT